MMHGGIDYGSKLAGTTVITFEQDGCLTQIQSEKKQDADQMILDWVVEHRPAVIYIDAPLSLPAAYYGRGSDYFYRQADKMLKAMSPMFIGGLTARAMKLKADVELKGTNVHEVYPCGFIRSQERLVPLYKKKETNSIPALMKKLRPYTHHTINLPTSFHSVDSFIAWIVGKRHLDGDAQFIGDTEEGGIWI